MGFLRRPQCGYSSDPAIVSDGECPVSEPMVIQSHKGPYDIHFADDALEALDAAVPDQTHFLIDRRVAELYGPSIHNILSSPSVLLVQATEDNKTLDRFGAYVQHLVDRGVRRDQMLIAIGGGILQDITAFLAATLLRGVAWRFLPTTLVAQADSCIGSKCAVNAGASRDILGAFTPPQRIDLSTRFLRTLDDRDLRSGVGEMLKIHAIDGPQTFDMLAETYDGVFTDAGVMKATIRRSLAIKKDYVERDEFDCGPRNLFNYGHSFGYAIEFATGFAVPHGIAVSIGMDMANWVAARLGVGSEAHYERMHPILKANYRGFDTRPVPHGRFLYALSRDKKNIGVGSVTLILPDRDGRMGRDSYPNDGVLADLCRAYLDTVLPSQDP